MITFPPITGRRMLAGERLDIYEQLMALIPRLDLMGEGDAANYIIQAVESLVDAPPCCETPHAELEAHADAIDAYEDAIRERRLG